MESKEEGYEEEKAELKGGDEKYSESKSESKQDAGMSSADGDYLIDQLQKYFYEDTSLSSTFENFVKEKSVIIDLDSDEYSLAYTEAYNEYRDMFESKMEAHIEKLGFSPIEFYRVIKDKTENDQNGSVALFAQILLGVTEFDIFMQMMREAARQFHSNRK